MKKFIMVAVLAIAMVASLNAKGQSVGQTFSVSGVYYKITSLSPNEVQLGNGNGWAFAYDPTGHYTILDSVTGGTNNRTYSVTSIGNGVFGGCSGLTYVTIPNSVTSIGANAFYHCSGLTSITIPYSVTSIGIDAFVGCSGLTAINVSGTNFKLANNVGSTQVVIPYNDNGLNDTCGNVVGCLAIGDLTIPASVTSIGMWAFYGCSGLTSVTIPNSVTSIGTSAFGFCSGLTSVTIPNSVTTIGDEAFIYCSGLTSVTWNAVNCTLPTYISYYYYPFYNMTSITNVTIGDSVQVIPNYLFYGCSGIDTIVSNATTPPTISSNTFSGVSTNIPVIIPCGTYTAYHSAPYWSNFQHLVVNGNVDTTSYNVSICNRPTDTYTDANFTTPLHNPGTYYAYLTNESGCDSVIVLNLSYYPQVPVT
ncbi:MAG: leucine-rich repeat domain-containing protein, partial [Bacteroidales bacterium]|nr:leucine-rich repeat domain-containing protein [Bacteroidales bacterium]